MVLQNTIYYRNRAVKLAHIISYFLQESGDSFIPIFATLIYLQMSTASISTVSKYYSPKTILAKLEDITKE
jgi:hypothetical protein